MQDRLDVAPVRPEQQPLSQLTFMGWAGEHVVDADGEGMRVFLTRLVVRWLWHVTPPPGAWRGRDHRLWVPGSDGRGIPGTAVHSRNMDDIPVFAPGKPGRTS